MKKRNSLFHSFQYAFSGLWYALRTQRNARIHMLATITITTMGLWLRLDAPRWAVLILTIALVFFAEMINTVAEVIIDMITTEYHPLAKIAKDVSAGAVLITALTAIIVGSLVLGPPLLARLGFIIAE